jgi:hypothetical protein
VTFRVYLPRVKRGAVAGKVAAASTGAASGRETVLVVEDGQAVRLLEGETRFPQKPFSPGVFAQKVRDVRDADRPALAAQAACPTRPPGETGRGSPPGPGLRQRSLVLSFAGFTTTRRATVSRPSAR